MAEQNRSAPSWHQQQRSAPPAPRGLWLWILEEEEENNLAEHRDAPCKERYQIWHTKWQLPGWKEQRSALFKWRSSTRKAELLNLFHLRGEKSNSDNSGTDGFFFSFIPVVLVQEPSWNANPVLLQLLSILRQNRVQSPATPQMKWSCGNELPWIINQSLVPIL